MLPALLSNLTDLTRTGRCRPRVKKNALFWCGRIARWLKAEMHKQRHHALASKLLACRIHEGFPTPKQTLACTFSKLGNPSHTQVGACECSPAKTESRAGRSQAVPGSSPFVGPLSDFQQDTPLPATMFVQLAKISLYWLYQCDRVSDNFCFSAPMFFHVSESASTICGQSKGQT